MILVRSRRGLRRRLREIRGAARPGEESTMALVPTMGFLHEGHLSLVDRAAELADHVVVSLFVNPLQFGPSEDLDRYPRDLDRDRKLLAERGASLCFAPSVDEMYPDGPPRVTVDPGPMAQGLCGAHRPGHFQGVLTVVARLFGLFTPDVAVFGRKDFQQAVLIRRMVRDLEIPVEVETAPIVREADGLALSSRNALLSPEERADAPTLYRALESARNLFRAGERKAAALLEEVRSRVAETSHLQIQYVELVDPEALTPVERAEDGQVLALAAFAGATRLIDNVILEAA